MRLVRVPRLPRWPRWAVGVAAAWLVLAGLLLPIGCGFRAVTGVPCPGCGGTRAMTALARGDLATALERSPLAVAALLLLAALAALRLALGLSPRLGRRALLLALLLVLANWAYVLASEHEEEGVRGQPRPAAHEKPPRRA